MSAFLEGVGVADKALHVLRDNDVCDLDTLRMFTKDDLLVTGLKVRPHAMRVPVSTAV